MKKIASCFEDCMQHIDLDIWDCITIYSISSETMQMQSQEYAVYDIGSDGFFCMASDYSHTLFLPLNPEFNVWVLKAWDLPIKLDPFLRKSNDLICIHIAGATTIEAQRIFEDYSAGTFNDTLKSRILFTPSDYSAVTSPLYPLLHHHPYKDNDTIPSHNQRQTVYVLYGKEACKRYDESFEKLYRSDTICFDVQKYTEDDTKVVELETKQWGASRKITIVEYGLLLNKLDDGI